MAQSDSGLKAYLTNVRGSTATLDGYTESLQKTAASYKDIAGTLATNFLSKAAGTLLNTALSTGASLVVNFAVSQISKWMHAQEELRQKTQEAAQTYSETAGSITDYSNRYEELHEQLLAANGDAEKTYQVKKQLLDLQTELNEKYGEEYGNLNLITDAYRNQADSIRAMSKEAAQDFLTDNRKGIEDAEEAMTKKESYMLSMSIGANESDLEKIQEIASKYTEEGLNVTNDIGDGSQYYVTLEADPQSAYETIRNFQHDLREQSDEFENESLLDSIFNDSSDALDRAKKTIDQYGEIYQQALMSEIAADDDKAQKFDEALQAVEAYNEAILQSEDPTNDQNIELAKQKIEELKAEMTNGEEWTKYRRLVNDVFEQAEQSIENLNDHIIIPEPISLSFTDKLSQIKTFSEGLGQLDKIYADVLDQGAFDWESILDNEAFHDIFGEFTEEYDNFIQTISSSPDDIDACQSSFDRLAESYLYGSDVIKNLSANTKDAAIAMLEQNGVTNANEIITARLAAQELFLAKKKNNVKITSDNLTEATWDELFAMREEMNASSAAGSYLAYMALSKLNLSNTSIDTDNDVNAVLDIARAAGISVEYVTLLQTALQNLTGAQNHVRAAVDLQKTNTDQKKAATYAAYVAFTKSNENKAKQKADSLLKQISNGSVETQSPNKVNFGNKPDTAPATPSTPSPGSSLPDPATEPAEIEEQPFEKVIDWIERRLESFKNKFDKWVKQAESAVTSGFVSLYYKKASSALKQEMSGYNDNYNYYMQKANEVGLEETYAQKVRNGTIEIETITNKALADQIEKYQEYYDKATEAATSFVETAEKFYNLPLDKAAAKIELFKNEIDLLSKKLDNATNSKDKKELIKQQLEQERNIKKANKTANTEAGKKLKSAQRPMKKITASALETDKKAVTDTKLLKSTSKSNRNKIKKAVKNGKKIDVSKLKKGSELYQKAQKYNASLKVHTAVKNKQEIDISKYKEGSAKYNTAVKYNTAAKAKTKAKYNYDVSKEDYKSRLIEATKARFDIIADKYEKKIQEIENQMTALDNEISQIEASGKRVDKSFYEKKKSQNDQMLSKLQKEKSALEKKIQQIQEGKNSEIIVGTDAWYEMLDQLQQVSSAISDCVTETYELNNAINQLHYDIFDDVSKSIDNIISEQEFLQGLFAHEKTTDQETGDLTEAGLAKLGSLSASKHAAKKKADLTGDEVKELQRMKDSGVLHSNTLGITFNSVNDLEEKLSEMYAQWRDDIKETYSIESEIADLMKDKYQAQLDLMKDLIDAKKESLNAEKDLHDYKRSIQEKTKDITTIQKQIAAYSGDSSQEGLAKLQKLQKELADKRDDLGEMEYDRYISDQQEMLDGLYQEYEELVTKKLDDFQALVDEGLATANDHAEKIASYLSSIAGGYTGETKGLYDKSKGDIQTNVDNTISTIKKNESKTEAPSAAQSAGTNSSQTEGATFKDALAQENQFSKESQKKTPIRHTVLAKILPEAMQDKVKEYIKNHASKGKKNREEYSAVNQAIHKNESKAYEGDGKILSSEELRELAKVVGVKYDGATKKGNLYKKLKEIDFPGFKKGGIVSVSDLKKQIRQNGDDGLASVSNGEAILTPAQTELFQKFTGQMPAMINHAASLANQNHLAAAASSAGRLQAISDSRNMANIVNIDSITLPNVTNYEEFKDRMFHDMQNDKKYIGFVKDVSINRIAGAGVLEKNRRVF